MPRRDRLTTRSAAPATDINRDITVRSITIRAASVDEKARSVEAVLATEAPVMVFDWQRFEIIDEVLIADGGEFQRQMPLLANHMRWSLDDVLGSIRDAKQESKQWTGRLYFAEGDDGADKAWNKVRQGHITDVSIGYRSINFVDIPAGQTQIVNGRSFTASSDRPLRITSRWQAKEGSLTPIGADQAAKIRQEHQGHQPPRNPKETAMNPKLRKYLESLGLRTDATDEQAKAYLGTLDGPHKTRADLIATGVIDPVEAQRSEPTPPAPAPVKTPETAVAATVDQDAMRAETIKLERTRITGLNSLRNPKASDTTRAAIDKIVDDAITSGAGVDATSRNVLEAERAAIAPAVGQGAPGAIIRGDQHRTADILAAGLMLRCGVTGTKFMPKPKTGGDNDTIRKHQEMLANEGDRYRDVSLFDLCRHALRIDGQPEPFGRDETIRAAMSTAAVTHIFTTSAFAVLMVAFMEGEDSTLGWCSEVDNANFLTQERTGANPMSGLQKHARGGEAKDMTFDTRQETYKIARHSGKFTVDEMDIIDDQLNVLMQRPKEIGQACARLRPELVYAIIIANAALGQDSVALFHSTHANTATNVFSAANLKTAVTAMGKQKLTIKGKTVNLNVRPTFLIVCNTLEFTARELLNSQQILIATGADISLERGNRNVIADIGLQLRVSSHIENGFTDPDGTARAGSTTRWLLATNPAQVPTIEVGYRAGTGRIPQLRSKVLDGGQWGILWDVNFDIGAKALAFQGLYQGNA